MFLLMIVGGQYAADFLYYHSLAWYVQGSLMLLIWVIAASIFKCGRMRTSRREEQLAKEREERLEEARNAMVQVTRDGN